MLTFSYEKRKIFLNTLISSVISKVPSSVSPALISQLISGDLSEAGEPNSSGESILELFTFCKLGAILDPGVWAGFCGIISPIAQLFHRGQPVVSYL